MTSSLPAPVVFAETSPPQAVHITSFAAPTPIEVAAGTAQGDIPFPQLHANEGALAVEVAAWNCAGYDASPGAHVFTPTLPQGKYTLAEGVALPQLTVTVKPSASGAADESTAQQSTPEKDPGEDTAGGTGDDSAAQTGKQTIQSFTLPEEVRTQTVPLGTPIEELLLPDTVTAHLDEEETREIPVSGWTPQPAYQPAQAGSYLFTPRLQFPEYCTLPQSLAPPQITITVEAPARAPILRASASDLAESIRQQSGGELTVTQDGNVLTVTGNITTSDPLLRLELVIDAGVTVLWKAYINNQSETSHTPLSVTGTGTFSLEEGGRIECAKAAQALYVSGTNIIMNGGTIINNSGEGIHIANSDSCIIKTGSTVKASKTALYFRSNIMTSYESGILEIQGGSITSVEGPAADVMGITIMSGGELFSNGSSSTLYCSSLRELEEISVTVSGSARIQNFGTGIAINTRGHVVLSGDANTSVAVFASGNSAISALSVSATNARITTEGTNAPTVNCAAFTANKATVLNNGSGDALQLTNKTGEYRTWTLQTTDSTITAKNGTAIMVSVALSIFNITSSTITADAGGPAIYCSQHVPGQINDTTITAKGAGCAAIQGEGAEFSLSNSQVRAEGSGAVAITGGLSVTVYGGVVASRYSGATKVNSITLRNGCLLYGRGASLDDLLHTGTREITDGLVVGWATSQTQATYYVGESTDLFVYPAQGWSATWDIVGSSALRYQKNSWNDPKYLRSMWPGNLVQPKGDMSASILLSDDTSTFTGSEQDFPVEPSLASSFTPVGTSSWSWSFAVDTNVPGNNAKLGAAQKPFNAGTYLATVTYTDGAHTGSKTVKLTIGTAALTNDMLTLQQQVPYTGKLQVPTHTLLFNAYTLQQGTDYTLNETGWKDIGPHTFTAAGKGNFTGSVTRAFDIVKGTYYAAQFSFGPTSVTYTGQPQSVYPVTRLDSEAGTVSGPFYKDSGGEVSGQAPTNAGTYTICIQVTGTEKYHPIEAPNYLEIGTFTIRKATPTAADFSCDLTSQVYNGTAKPLSVTPLPGITGMGAITVKYNGATASPVNAGTYTVTINMDEGANYWGAVDFFLGNFIIEKAAPTANGFSLEHSTATYDGIPKPATVNTSLAGAGTVTVYYDGAAAPPTNAGTYAVTIDVAEGANYLMATGLPLGNYTVNRAALTATDFSFTPSGATYNGTPQPVAVQPSLAGLGTITVLYNGSSTVPTNAGTYTIAVNIPESANHLAASSLPIGNYIIGTLDITGTQTSLAGQNRVGQTLTASVAGVPSAHLAFTWYRDGVPIAGHTGPTYRLADADSNKAITASAAVARVVNHTGTASESDPVAVQKHSLYGAIRIFEQTNGSTAGILDNGDVLGVDLAGLLPASERGKVSYIWSIDGTVVGTSSTYTVTYPGDYNKIIQVTVTADPAGDFTGTLQARARIGHTPRPGLSGSFTIQKPAGTPASGTTLTIADSVSGDHYFVWLRDGQPISGVSGGSYTLRRADLGTAISAIAYAQGNYEGSISSSNSIDVPVEQKAQSVALRPATLTLEAGETARLTATVAPDSTKDKQVTFSTSAPAVATVSASGLVTAVAEGTATVTATTANGKTASCAVTVTAAPAAASEEDISKTEIPAESKQDPVYLRPGGSQRLPGIEGGTWRSSDPSIVSVDENGNITAHRGGTAVITVTGPSGEVLTYEIHVSASYTWLWIALPLLLALGVAAILLLRKRRILGKTREPDTED